jgi:hypothetical protein
MSLYAIHTSDTGRLVSIGSVVADPLPQGLTAVELSVDDGRSMRDGTGAWDADTRTVVALPPDPAIVNETTITDQIATALDANRTFLAVESPTNAQTLAQVKALTRQTQALIRLVTAQTADGVD